MKRTSNDSPMTQVVREISAASDPSMLTTQQLLRELENLKENIYVRLDANDKATKLYEENMARFPTDVDKAVSQLKELHNEKFESVAMQFKERDHVREESGRSARLAMEQALAAAKEAVGKENMSSAMAISKSEASMTKQLDGMMVLIGKIESGFNSKIDDMKQRIVALENGQAASMGRSSGAANLWGIIVGAVGVLSGLAGFLAFILSRKP